MHHLIFPLRFLLLVVLSVPSLALGASPIQERADRFLKLANAGYQALFRVNSETQWLAVTNVTPEHDASAEATGKAYAAFNGNPAIISEARDLLVHQNELNELTVRQLKLKHGREGIVVVISRVVVDVRLGRGIAEFFASRRRRLDPLKIGNVSGKPFGKTRMDYQDGRARITSLVMDIISRCTRAPKFLTCCASARRRDSMKALAN